MYRDFLKNRSFCLGAYTCAAARCSFLSFYLLVWSLGNILLINPVRAQSSEDTSVSTKSELSLRELKTQLRDVDSQIKSQRKRLKKLDKERESIGGRLAELESAQNSTISQKERTQETVVKLSTEGERLKLTLFGARQQMEHQRARMHRRLVALYKTNKRSPSADYLFRADSTTDLLKRAKYLSRVTEHDQEYISQLSKVVRRGQNDRRRLEELLGERRAKLGELTELGKQLEMQKFQTASLLREQEVKKEQQEASLVALRLSANQLQKMLGEMMDSQQANINSGTPAVGVGLARVKGSLPFPVSGVLVQNFGKQRHTEFEDILFKKGLEVAAIPGEAIKAVAPGRVILQQELPGYGQVVIVDHGHRYYTLYGRVAEIKVSVGEEVKQAQQLAVTGPLDSRGRNFYFELRYRGKARNPGVYFKNLPKES